MDVLPDPVLAPDPKVVVHHLPWGQVMTEQARRTATPDTIKIPSRFCSQEGLVWCKVPPDQDLEFILSLLTKETSYEWCHRYCQYSEAGRC